MQVSMPAVFASKKATIAIFSSVLAYFCLRSGFTTEQVMVVCAPLIAYVPVQGAVDHREKKNSKPQPPVV